MLILSGLYESLGLAREYLKEGDNPNNLQIGGPIWILPLWLNATFKPSLKTRVPPNLEVGVEGIRMAQLTPNDGKVFYLEIFENSFQLFYRCKTFTSTIEPFSSR